MAKRSKKPDFEKLFDQAADSIRDEYRDRRGVMSFTQYLSVFARRPRTALRDASRYVLDAMDYFGSARTLHPWGEVTRHKIFDLDYDDGSRRLVGQEKAQSAVRSAIASQVRDGGVNRLLLIHGPNGSAKSTLINGLFSGMDRYSRLDEGEMFRFRWIFPARKTSTERIGFRARLDRGNQDTFAHLEDDEVDATLDCEFRDHPLLLIPKAERRDIMEKALEDAGIGDYKIPEHFFNASLCHRCRQIADALMRTHRGDIKRVLAHVQVEPWAFSRRYMRGLVQVGPQRSIDAGQRQVTADRSLSALPHEMQNMTLFESFGPLVFASGGILEFEDMLKRPLDSFKYLLGSIESGEATIGQSIIRLNTVLIATSNDVMLEAFREHHEYPSFRDRITLIPVPYMTRMSDERQIYELQLVPHIGRHVAPHAVSAAAHWSVLTRLHKPNPDAYSESLAPVIKDLTAAQKCELYDSGIVPEDLDDEAAAELLDAVPGIQIEDAATWQYEGRYGASPRLIRQVLLTASLREDFDCLSPFSVIEELEAVSGRTREYAFLEIGEQEGGYHSHVDFLKVVEKRVLDRIEVEVRSASGLVEEHRHEVLLDKYVSHVSRHVKGEKILNESTGQDEDPDETMMGAVEESFGIEEGDREEYRKGVISRIAAWAIEHPGQKMMVAAVLPGQLQRLRTAYFDRHREKVARVARLAMRVMEGDEAHMEEAEKTAGRKLKDRMIEDHGYCESCARDGIGRLLAERFKDN